MSHVRVFKVGDWVDFEYLDGTHAGFVEAVSDAGNEQRLRVRWPDNSISHGLASGYRLAEKGTGRFKGKADSALPHNVPGVDKVKDILHGLVGFSSEGDVDQALTSLRDVIDDIAALRPDLRLLFSDSFLTGARRGFAVSIEKVNAHIG